MIMTLRSVSVAFSITYIRCPKLVNFRRHTRTRTDMDYPRFEPGHKIVLIAPSGYGKSTLVKSIIETPELFSFVPKHTYVVGPGADKGDATIPNAHYLQTLPISASLPKESIIVAEDVQLWDKEQLKALEFLFLSAANHHSITVFCTLQSSLGSTRQNFWRLIQANASHIILFDAISTIQERRRLSKNLGHSAEYLNSCMILLRKQGIKRPYVVIDLTHTPPLQTRTLPLNGDQSCYAFTQTTQYA